MGYDWFYEIEILTLLIPVWAQNRFRFNPVLYVVLFKTAEVFL